MDTKSKTCCFTGHRDLPHSESNEIKNRLRNEIRRLAQRGVVYYGVGGALGFDTIAALTVLEMKAELTQLRLILVLPHPGQSDMWNEYDRKVYDDILHRADKTVYMSKQYDDGCMSRRNRWLVDNSSVCICYVNRPSGGAAATAAYAIESGLEVINLTGIRQGSTSKFTF